MHPRPRSAVVPRLLVFACLLAVGCDREWRAPTGVSPQAGDVEAASPTLEARDGITPGSGHGRDRWYPPRGPVVAEAEEALGAVLTGEQAYCQRYMTHTDATDTDEIRVKLGVYLDEPGERWAFAVSGATTTGFIARAEGRDGTRAEGIVVTLTYERGQPLVWRFERRGRGRP